MDRIQSAVGLLVLILISWLLSDNRRKVDFRVVLGCLFLQFPFALLFLKIAFFKDCFMYLNQVAKTLQDASLAGTRFAFGYIGGGDAPFEVTNPGNLFVFAFQGLPIVLFISAE
jgi:CNT family concentrative nucleoside transporter